MGSATGAAGWTRRCTVSETKGGASAALGNPVQGGDAVERDAIATTKRPIGVEELYELASRKAAQRL